MDLKIDFLGLEEENLNEFPDGDNIKNVFINMYGRETVFPVDAKILSTLAEKYSNSKVYILNMHENVREGLQFVINNNKNIKVLLK